MIICSLHPSMRKEGNRHVSVLDMGEDSKVKFQEFHMRSA